MALVLMDMAVNALCLCMVQKLMNRRTHGWRTALGAGFGALAAWILRHVQMERLLEATLWLPIALGMVRIAVGRRPLRAALLLLAAAGLIGGTVSALAGATGSLAAGWGIGVIAVSFMAAGAKREKRAACDLARAEVTVTIHGCSASFEGIIDSGNCLRDYFSHRSVVVLPEGAKAQLGLCGAALRPIFADTAGGRMMMDCVTAERTQIMAEGFVYDVQACVAFSPGLAGGAPALIPAALVQKAQ